MTEEWPEDSLSYGLDEPTWDAIHILQQASIAVMTDWQSSHGEDASIRRSRGLTALDHARRHLRIDSSWWPAREITLSI